MRGDFMKEIKKKEDINIKDIPEPKTALTEMNKAINEALNNNEGSDGAEFKTGEAVDTVSFENVEAGEKTILSKSDINKKAKDTIEVDKFKFDGNIDNITPKKAINSNYHNIVTNNVLIEKNILKIRELTYQLEKEIEEGKNVLDSQIDKTYSLNIDRYIELDSETGAGIDSRFTLGTKGNIFIATFYTPTAHDDELTVEGRIEEGAGETVILTKTTQTNIPSIDYPDWFYNVITMEIPDTYGNKNFRALILNNSNIPVVYTKAAVTPDGLWAGSRIDDLSDRIEAIEEQNTQFNGAISDIIADIYYTGTLDTKIVASDIRLGANSSTKYTSETPYVYNIRPTVEGNEYLKLNFECTSTDITGTGNEAVLRAKLKDLRTNKYVEHTKIKIPFEEGVSKQDVTIDLGHPTLRLDNYDLEFYLKDPTKHDFTINNTHSTFVFGTKNKLKALTEDATYTELDDKTIFEAINASGGGDGFKVHETTLEKYVEISMGHTTANLGVMIGNTEIAIIGDNSGNQHYEVISYGDVDASQGQAFYIDKHSSHSKFLIENIGTSLPLDTPVIVWDKVVPQNADLSLTNPSDEPSDYSLIYNETGWVLIWEYNGAVTGGLQGDTITMTDDISKYDEIRFEVMSAVSQSSVQSPEIRIYKTDIALTYNTGDKRLALQSQFIATAGGDQNAYNTVGWVQFPTNSSIFLQHLGYVYWNIEDASASETTITTHTWSTGGAYKNGVRRIWVKKK